MDNDKTIYSIMLLEGKEQIPCVYHTVFLDMNKAYKQAYALCNNTEYNDFIVYESKIGDLD